MIGHDVSDGGPGMPPKEQACIVEHFGLLDNSNTKAKGGPRSVVIATAIIAGQRCAHSLAALDRRHYSQRRKVRSIGI